MATDSSEPIGASSAGSTRWPQKRLITTALPSASTPAASESARTPAGRPGQSPSHGASSSPPSRSVAASVTGMLKRSRVAPFSALRASSPRVRYSVRPTSPRPPTRALRAPLALSICASVTSSATSMRSQGSPGLLASAARRTRLKAPMPMATRESGSAADHMRPAENRIRVCVAVAASSRRPAGQNVGKAAR